MHQFSFMPTKPKQAAGFTLIELSIVLVIIGLVAGGVLVGNSLINTAKIRGEVSKIQSIKSAVAAFQLEYDCLPGDCKDGLEWGLSSSGNGDGLMYIYGDAAATVNMLAEVGLIDAIESPSIGKVVPSKLLDSMAYWLGGFVDTKKNYIMQMEFSSMEGDGPLGGSAPSAKQAYQMDSKIDDGLPFAGQIQVIPLSLQYFSSDKWGDLVGSVDADCASSTDYTVTDATYKRGDQQDCPFIIELGY